jgi:Reverse transcriptase (RNA-dependent DNA polymerase)
MEQYKTRLVAKGYTQTRDIDYHEIFAPVIKMNTVRILLSITVNNNWNLYQIDVKNTFLQGALEEEVYMTLPPDHQRENNSNLVCRLNKSIYGLKQSPRAWYGKLSQFLISCNFKVSGVDSSLFIKHNTNGTTVVLVYVNDIITARLGICSSSNSVSEFSASLSSKSALHMTCMIQDFLLFLKPLNYL